MEQEVKTKENGGMITRAEKKDAAKGIIRELLQKKSYKAGELIDEAAKLYAERFQGEDTENVNDVKGRMGSVIDVMKKEEELSFDGGMYALKTVAVVENKAESVAEKPKKPVRKTTKKAKKAAVEKADAEQKTGDEKEKEEKAPVAVEETTEKPAKKRTSRKKSAAVEEKKEELTTEEKETEKKPVKKRAVKKKAEVKTETAAVEAAESVAETANKETPSELAATLVTEEKEEVKEKEKIGESAPHAVMDMSFLFGDVKGAKKAEKPVEKKETVNAEAPKTETKEEQSVKVAEKTVAAKTQEKSDEKATKKPRIAATATGVEKTTQNTKKQPTKRVEQPKKPARTMTADEKLKEAFLKKLRKLGGEYFEYYSVYLLEKYSRMNGRRLEGLKISAGDRDGGIDGEIDVTDRLGFRETIYIQAKNWDPDKGDEKLWVVGETLLQQFIGACVCRQAKEGKQHCRGIFITTSRFTPEAKRILEDTADKFVGYDGEDLYETAKECGFGIVKKNGEYVLDEALLSGEKAFFNMI